MEESTKFCRLPEGKKILGAGVISSPEEADEEASICFSTITCLWCEVCQLMCPEMCIVRNPHTGQIRIDLNYCKGCGLCAYYCPKGAIKMVVEKK